MDDIMKIDRKKIDDIHLVTISGRIDISSARDLDSFLNNIINNKSKLILDLSGTEYISSTGLRILITAHKNVREKKGEMRFASLQPLIRNIMDISGLSNVFLIHPNIKDAVNAFGLNSAERSEDGEFSPPSP